MYWLEVSVITDGEGAEAVAEKLRPFAYNEGVVLEQLGDMTSPALDALETAVTVKIYIPEDQDSPQLRRRIEEVIHFLGLLYPIPPPTYRQLEEEDWANAWKAHYQPFRVGIRIWIQPSWVEVDADPALSQLQPDDVILVLDPGMAFGTGLHPTTQMCLRALETLVTGGETVLDVGTGSGILGVAAAKLGAAAIFGFDVDDLAVKTAVDNAQKNDVTNFKIEKTTLPAITGRTWDLVLVNILAPVIINFFKQDRLMDFVKVEGRLVLSGIIDEQAAAVETAVTAARGTVVQKMVVGDWVTLIVRHKRKQA